MMKTDTLIINLFGGPCCGKSTAAAELFAYLKKLGYHVELVTEYAKDMTWEKRFNALDDQIYIFAKQYRKLSRLFGEVDIIIVDSPLLMCATYIRKDYYTNLYPLIQEVWNNCNNVNYVVERATKYSKVGRSQTEQEAVDKDQQIIELLHHNKVPFTYVDVVNNPQSLYDSVLTEINNFLNN